MLVRSFQLSPFNVPIWPKKHKKTFHTAIFWRVQIRVAIMICWCKKLQKVGLIWKLLMRAFSWCPWIPGTLKLDSILSLFKCVQCLISVAFKKPKI